MSGSYARRWITGWGSGLLVTYAIAAGVCLATRKLDAIYTWFLFLGVPSLVLSSGVESLLALAARTYFSPGQPMRECWLWLAAAAGCRFAGYLLAHFLLPLFGAQPGSPWQMWGLVLGGPLSLLCTAFGLNQVTVLLRRHRWVSQLAAADWTVLAVLLALLVRHLFEIQQDLAGHGFRSYAQALLWFTEPLLCLVVLQSLGLRRSAVRMGSGLVARCWSALAAAALLIGLGDVQAWVHRTFHLAEAIRALTDPVWVVAGITGALAPAFQIEASSLALSWKPTSRATSP